MHERLIITEQKKADQELARAREAEKAARSYDSLFVDEFVLEEEYDAEGKRVRKTARELEEEFM